MARGKQSVLVLQHWRLTGGGGGGGWGGGGREGPIAGLRDVTEVS